MLGMTIFGMLHTAIALVAVAGGLLALVRHGEISFRTKSGRTYVWFTVATCITGLFLFHHGGFGAPHVLAITTLIVLAIAYLAETRASQRRLSRYVAVLGYSLTFFFHFIPGFTETGTRVPVGHPAFSGPEDPALKILVGICFLIYLAGAAVQATNIRRAHRLVGTT
ncbi:hypothetical protein [Pseudomonas chlororaphis]|uniref:hypothetical protein n=1 Tax=Pseudomonas chlororaphis TaxID=587753 RepID=UPI000F55F2FC|nr:hypothetical protein [Pseudomonas chlororaphis]AZD54597.1 hypothetical protein C4K19_2810 [Pseudomonas chlororaphis subsp. aurantiaca]UVE48339.1 hypothetical protein KS461_14000 [Pseudomonas chlororaphis]